MRATILISRSERISCSPQKTQIFWEFGIPPKCRKMNYAEIPHFFTLFSTVFLSFLKREHERDFERPMFLTVSWLFLSFSGIKKVTNGQKLSRTLMKRSKMELHVNSQERWTFVTVTVPSCSRFKNWRITINFYVKTTEIGKIHAVF